MRSYQGNCKREDGNLRLNRKGLIMSNHSDKAEQLFRSGYNCAQSVFGAFSDATGIDFEYAVKMSAPFGGGFGRLREVCGAACGMTLAGGCLFGYSSPSDYTEKKENYELERKMMNAFADRMGSYVCRDILGELARENSKDNSPSIRTEEFYTKRPCLKCIRTAAEILDSEIENR